MNLPDHLQRFVAVIAHLYGRVALELGFRPVCINVLFSQMLRITLGLFDALYMMHEFNFYILTMAGQLMRLGQIIFIDILYSDTVSLLYNDLFTMI